MGRWNGKNRESLKRKKRRLEKKRAHGKNHGLENMLWCSGPEVLIRKGKKRQQVLFLRKGKGGRGKVRSRGWGG